MGFSENGDMQTFRVFSGAEIYKRIISDATALVFQKNKERLQQPSRPSEDLHFR